MTTLIFDIEANGFLAEATKLHCIWIEDLETGEREGFGPNDIALGIDRLAHADVLVGHNILKYDLAVIEKLSPGALAPVNVDTAGVRYVDTLVLTRLLWPDLRATDKNMGKLTGSHSLRAWGERLKVAKGDYEGGFAEWNQEMHDYCEQDVVVTRALYDRCLKKLGPWPRAVTLEHEFAFIMTRMEANGFGFDEAAGADLYATLSGKRIQIADKLKQVFPPEVIEETIIAKANNRTLGRVKGQPYVKQTVVEFNPSSRQHIARRLQATGWVPHEFTDNGQPKIDETILSAIPTPEAALLNEHFLVEKRIGQLAEGDNAWLKLSTNGVIHGAINTNGAVTGRCTHSRPNISQVPKVGSPYGAECRALFRPTRPGFVQVGADLSGIELRCKAHFLAAYDGGAYAKVLLEGDIHWANACAFGLATGDNDGSTRAKIARNASKTLVYAYLYGAGNRKIGTIVHEFFILALEGAGENAEASRLGFFGTKETPSEAQIEACGKKVKARFLKRMPALGKLVGLVGDKVQRTHSLRGLDGRALTIRSAHSALNTLLQSAGAVIAKQATVEAWRLLHSAGFEHGKDWGLMAHVHDELQVECRPEHADRIGEILIEGMSFAGKAMNLRIQIAGEYHAGRNWRDCH